MVTESLANWAHGAQALALVNAAQQRGYTTYLAEARTPQEFEQFSGLPARVAGDVLAALVAHGVVERAGERFRLTDDMAGALGGLVDFAAQIEEAVLGARLVDSAVRTGEAPLTPADALVVAKANALRPSAPGAGGLVAKLFESTPEMWEAMTDGRLLDVGSGVSGFVLSAATVLPRMRATTIELVPSVAEVAAARAAELGVSDRIDVRVMDAREFDAPGEYDAVFWAQPFFPEPVRAATLAMIRRSLRPGGFLLVQQLDAVPDEVRPAFTLRQLVAGAQQLAFARPLDDLVTEITAAGFELVRSVVTDLGPVALLRRPPA
ncbi:class I SAM-dependent methyltransferase [Actinoplanes sp. TRM 88003]|uniref:Class I SAM-dependent methyltransferase n=1 Tax=Paractinoplanes aksuensis TaxID=2939490 RepID=A0ABT1DKX5_9ACTN|nr:class I SAM-dependent methyltransferase [Actinoplanes aksuensis]MCO8271501.1 class I SAM-dependent methyltransferase [Actinoplanes aksuensis]